MDIWESLPSYLPPSSHHAPKLKTGEVQMTLAPGSILEGQGWVLSLPTPVSQILHSHINPPLPNIDSFSIAAPPQTIVLINLCLLSIFLSPLQGRKKRKKTREKLLTMPHRFFKEYQMQKAGTIILLWSKQGWDFTLSASEKRIKVERLV